MARRAPLCTHANLFAGCSRQVVEALLHAFPKAKEECCRRLEALVLERGHTQLDQGQLGLGKICTGQPELAIRIIRALQI